MLPNPKEAAYQFGWMAAKDKKREDNPYLNQDFKLWHAWERGYSDHHLRLLRIRKVMDVHDTVLRELAETCVHS